MTMTAEEPRRGRSLGAATRQASGWRVTGIVVLALVALLLGACGSSTTSATTATSAHPTTTTATKATSSSNSAEPATSLTIVIKNYAFHPDKAVVAPGAHLVIENEDSVTHTFTSTTGAFNTGDIHPGQKATLVAPTKPGNYPYYCEIHPFMTGVLTVK